MGLRHSKKDSGEPIHEEKHEDDIFEDNEQERNEYFRAKLIKASQKLNRKYNAEKVSNASLEEYPLKSPATKLFGTSNDDLVVSMGKLLENHKKSCTAELKELSSGGNAPEEVEEKFIFLQKLTDLIVKIQGQAKSFCTGICDKVIQGFDSILVQLAEYYQLAPLGEEKDQKYFELKEKMLEKMTLVEKSFGSLRKETYTLKRVEFIKQETEYLVGFLTARGIKEQPDFLKHFENFLVQFIKSIEKLLQKFLDDAEKEVLPLSEVRTDGEAKRRYIEQEKKLKQIVETLKKSLRDHEARSENDILILTNRLVGDIRIEAEFLFDSLELSVMRSEDELLKKRDLLLEKLSEAKAVVEELDKLSQLQMEGIASRTQVRDCQIKLGIGIAKLFKVTEEMIKPPQNDN
eukprot:TRINITY_DN96_c0_g1_i1.p1 TRINITY_DN96_c0_g1~~TRINITY_DN96_c0_g1_i1.p1  ORF type:complete len:404 (+),score=80.73 TRINITY_DN96_c0_g1_i1:58-1269(+)